MTAAQQTDTARDGARQNARWRAIGGFDVERGEYELGPPAGERGVTGEMFADQDALAEQDVVNRPVKTFLPQVIDEVRRGEIAGQDLDLAGDQPLRRRDRKARVPII